MDSHSSCNHKRSSKRSNNHNLSNPSPSNNTTSRETRETSNSHRNSHSNSNSTSKCRLHCLNNSSLGHQCLTHKQCRRIKCRNSRNNNSSSNKTFTSNSGLRSTLCKPTLTSRAIHRTRSLQPEPVRQFPSLTRLLLVLRTDPTPTPSAQTHPCNRADKVVTLAVASASN